MLETPIWPHGHPRENLSCPGCSHQSFSVSLRLIDSYTMLDVRTCFLGHGYHKVLANRQCKCWDMSSWTNHQKFNKAMFLEVEISNSPCKCWWRREKVGIERKDTRIVQGKQLAHILSLSVTGWRVNGTGRTIALAARWSNYSTLGGGQSWKNCIFWGDP